jgi:two-component system response regulator ChvI
MVSLVTLDLSLGQEDGLSLAREIRTRHDVPIIMVSGKGDTVDRIVGLEIGADDYISKPFSQRLLIARIRALLRRQDLARGAGAATSEPGDEDAPLIERGRLVMDPARHKVLWDSKDVTLTVTEFLILEALAQRPGVVKSRNQLLDIAYQDDVYVDDRTIDSHIKRIRRKFRTVDSEFDAIETLYGVGYKFGEE